MSTTPPGLSMRECCCGAQRRFWREITPRTFPFSCTKAGHAPRADAPAGTTPHQHLPGAPLGGWRAQGSCPGCSGATALGALGAWKAAGAAAGKRSADGPRHGCQRARAPTKWRGGISPPVDSMGGAWLAAGGLLGTKGSASARRWLERWMGQQGLPVLKCCSALISRRNGPHGASMCCRGYWSAEGGTSTDAAA